MKTITLTGSEKAIDTLLRAEKNYIKNKKIKVGQKELKKKIENKKLKLNLKTK